MGSNEITMVRRYLGTRQGVGDLVSSRDPSFGALRILDDVLIDPGSHITVGPQDGFEVVVYVLDGECAITDERGHEIELRRDAAGYFVLGDGVRQLVSNRGTGPLRVLVAAVVAPTDHPVPRSAVGAFTRQAPGISWLSSPEDGAPSTLGSSVRLGIATLPAGRDLWLDRRWNRGFYVSVLDGNIELGSSFLFAGGDARVSPESDLRVQGVIAARVVIVDAAMGFTQQLVSP